MVVPVATPYTRTVSPALKSVSFTVILRRFRWEKVSVEKVSPFTYVDIRGRYEISSAILGVKTRRARGKSDSVVGFG